MPDIDFDERKRFCGYCNKFYRMTLQEFHRHLEECERERTRSIKKKRKRRRGK